MKLTRFRGKKNTQVSLFLSDEQVTKPHCYYMWSGKPLGNPWATFRQLILKTLFACEPTLNFLNVLTEKMEINWFSPKKAIYYFQG